MNFQPKRRRGTTLPEVVTVAFAFVLLLYGLVAMSVSAGNQWSYGSSQLMTDNDASLAIQRAAADMRDGISATTSNGGTQLAVQMPAVNDQGDYDRTTNGSVYNYYVSSGKLYRQIGTNTAVQLGRKI